MAPSHISTPCLFFRFPGLLYIDMNGQTSFFIVWITEAKPGSSVRFPVPPFCFPAEDDSFNQNGKNPDDQENIESEETPDQQRQTDGSVLKNIPEIQQKTALLRAAGTGKRGIACADKQQAADGQNLMPGGS